VPDTASRACLPRLLELRLDLLRLRRLLEQTGQLDFPKLPYLPCNCGAQLRNCQEDPAPAPPCPDVGPRRGSGDGAAGAPSGRWPTSWTWPPWPPATPGTWGGGALAPREMVRGGW